MFPSRGSARRSKRSTSYPRRPRYAASKPPANPLPIRTNFATPQESTNQQRRKAGKADAVRFTASDTDALQFFECVAEVFENIARQKRLLAVVGVEDCD